MRRTALPLLAGLLATGCLRLDVTEGGSVALSAEGEACPGFTPAPPAEPERIAESCHLYGIPAQVTLSATAHEGFAFSRWEGDPGFDCAGSTAPECAFEAAAPTYALAVFEPVVPAFTPDSISLGHDQIAYLHSAALGRVFRHSLLRGRALAPIALAPGSRHVAYAEATHRLYVARADGSLAAIDLASSRDERPFAALPGAPEGLGAVGSFVAAYHRGSSSDVLSLFGADGAIAGSASGRYRSRFLEWSPANQRLYHLRDALRPDDVLYDAINAATGAIGLSRDGPYHGDFPIAPPLRVSPDGSLLLLGSGDLYDARTLAHVRALPRTFTDAAWSSQGLLTLEERAGGGTLLERWSSAFRVADLARFEGRPLRVLEWAGGFAVATLVAGRPAFHAYRPSSDADADGTPNDDDAFPLDPAAARDGDGDRAPDAWNPGRAAEDSTDGLVLDAFPLDSACAREEEGTGGACDVAAAVPAFVPDRVVGDPEGVVYLLSRARERVYRWSVAGSRWLNPIVLREAPTDLAYSEDPARLYVGHVDGGIDEIDPASPHREHPFAATTYRTDTLAAAGATLVASEQYSNWWRWVTFAPDGRQVSFAGGVSDPRGQMSWSGARSRLYASTVGQWLDLDPATHAARGFGFETLYPPRPLTPLVRASLDGRLALQGPRFVYDTVSRRFAAELPEDVADGLWRADGPVTLSRTPAGATRLVQRGLAYETFGARELPGEPLRLLAWRGGLVAVTQQAGRPAFHAHVPTDDADGDGVANLADAFTLDPAASVDGDLDGAPDAWNAGRGPADSTTGLALDAFPDEPACWAPEHERGGVCDVARRIPAYSPDRVVQDAAGVVYLLSAAKGRLFRWSFSEAYHLEPVAIGPGATDVAYLEEPNRLYLAHDAGSLTQLEPGASPVEAPFASGATRLIALAAAGRYLVTWGAIGTTGYLGVYASDGTRISEGRASASREMEWNAASGRLYHRDDRFSSPTVLWREIDQGTGAWGALRVSSVPGAFGLVGPVRVSPDATRLLLGSGHLFDAASFDHVAQLVPKVVVDALWLDEGVLTLHQDANGDGELRRWDARRRLVAVEVFRGAPLRVVGWRGQVLVITTVDGRPAFSLAALDDDADGDGVPLASDAFPMDRAASADSDGDGAPEAWNPGMGAADSTTGLATDAFPDDFACQLASHAAADGRCEFALVLPADRDTPLCASDDPPALAAPGVLTLGPTADYLPLCDGWLVHADTEGDRVVVQNAFDGRLGRIFPLGSRPGVLALDDASRTLFAVLPEESAVAVIDLATSEVRRAAVPAVPAIQGAIAAGEGGELFVAVPWSGVGRATLYHLAAGAPAATGGWTVEGLLLAWTAPRRELVVADHFGSDLLRYAFDPVTGPALLQQHGAMSSGRELALSPDGRRVIYSGATSGYGYVLLDRDAADLASVLGTWNTGPYPRSAAFDPTSSLVVATSGSGFLLYDVETHAELARAIVPGSGYCSFAHTSVSRGGRIAFLEQRCGTGATAFVRIAYWVLPAR